MSSNQPGTHEPRRDQVPFHPPPAIVAAQGSAVSAYSPIQVTHYGEGKVKSKVNIQSYLFLPSIQEEREAIVAALKTRHVPHAVYDAQLDSGCMEGTRVQILKDIEDWIKDPNAPQIFWLTGMAGTGKTAIAWTICVRARKDVEIVFGGSFFCSRSTGSVAQRDVRCVVPTLAQLLARQSSEFSKALGEELARDPDILHKQVTAQIEHLLYNPLLALKDSLVQILFVIDALDECGGLPTADGTPNDAECRRIVSEVLEALVKFSRSSVKLPVKFLVTSRPEPHIRDTSVSDVELSRILRLHTVDKELVNADIRLYISKRLSSSAKLQAQFAADEIAMLTQLCDGLFIVAATALEHILGEGIDITPIKFQTLLSSSRDSLSNDAAASLDSMYAIILADASTGKNPGVNELGVVLKLLAALLTAQMTLSISALADLMNLPRTHVRASLARLHAVVHVPDRDDEAGLRTLHASFGDYLFGRAKGDLKISRSLGDETLARGCLCIMSKMLHFNVSRSRTSYEPNSAGKPDTITLSLEYACLHWVYHVASLQQPSILDEDVNEVFCPRVLFWLEVMSVLGRVWRAAAMLFFAASTVELAELSRFLRDAHTFVASSREAIEKSAPHIYLSALPFAAKGSMIRETFSPQFNGLVSVNTFGIEGHGGRLAITLTGHEDAVNSVAYSPDGRLLVTGSDDGTVRIWDTRIGEETVSPPRGGDGPVFSVAFTSHGKIFASGMHSGVVCLWVLSCGQMTPKRLEGHSAAVSCVAFSPGNSLLASASRDGTVRVWIVETCSQLAVLSGHTGEVTAVAFSHDSQILSSCSMDRTIRLWHTITGMPAGDALLGHNGWVVDVSFSPVSMVLASASQDRTIRLWDVQMRRNIATLSGHSDWICSVQFSRDGKSLVSASHDRTVRLWRLEDDATNASSIVLDGHALAVNSATFSPDGLYIASGSDDNTVRIWDARTGQALIEPLSAHNGPVRSIAISSDGTCIVSGSSDCTVRVWDVQTDLFMFAVLSGHTGCVSSVDISSDRLLIASGSEDSTIRLWHAQTGYATCDLLQSAVDQVNDVKFSPDALWLASASNDNKVHIWNVTTRRLSAVGPLICAGPAQAVVFSPDGRLIASSDSAGYLHLWDAVTGQPLRQLVLAEAQSVNSIAFSATGTSIVTSLPNKEGRVWDINSGLPAAGIAALFGHTAPICSIAYTGNDQFIVSGSDDTTVRLWHAETGSPILAFLGHKGSVRSIASTTDGCIIASCSDDQTIRIWNVNAARPLSVGCGGRLEAELISPKFDGEWLLGPSDELHLWVPAEYHQYLQVPPFTTVIGPHRVSIKVDISSAFHGDDWISCCRIPSATSGVSLEL